MARVKVEEIVDHLDTEFRKALRDTFNELAPNADIDERAAFRFFKRRVGRHTSSWESVPDSYVDAT
jgi:hypothetical protein